MNVMNTAIKNQSLSMYAFCCPPNAHMQGAIIQVHFVCVMPFFVNTITTKFVVIGSWQTDKGTAIDEQRHLVTSFAISQLLLAMTPTVVASNPSVRWGGGA